MTYNVCHSMGISFSQYHFCRVGREGFEPPKSKTNVLQTPCVEPLAYLPIFVGRTGFEPAQLTHLFYRQAQLSYVGGTPDTGWYIGFKLKV